MDEISEVGSAPVGTTNRIDALLRWLVILGVAAVLGLGGLLGYTVWQAQRTEETSTPAGRAIADLRNRVRANPNDAPLRVRLGEALASAGLLDDAVDQFKAALKIDDKHTGAYLDLGIVAMQEKEHSTAEGYFNKVIELTTGTQYAGVNQRREMAYFYLGEIALDDRRYEDAAANFKAALRIRRDASDTYYLLAQAYRGMQRNDAAMKQLDIALAFDPRYPEAHYLMGEIYLDEDDVINAAVHFRIAADGAPEHDLPQEALASLGTAEEALAKGEQNLKGGRVRKAIDDALLARALEPENLKAVLFHADVLVRAKETSAAIKAYKEALELAPENTTAKAALAELQPKKK